MLSNWYFLLLLTYVELQSVLFPCSAPGPALVN